ncbi:hypothetical protein D0N87_29495 [Pseudomonas sp. ATCC 13867]|nr:hypothetical protein D0N87_29495 [Pseudomonas sp. ATCC 13867]
MLDDLSLPAPMSPGNARSRGGDSLFRATSRIPPWSAYSPRGGLCRV